MKKTADLNACPIARAAGLVGDEKILLALRALFRGPQRFDELQKSTGAATNILSNRLARMIEAGIVSKQQYQDRPVRYDYRLTKAGMALFPSLLALWRFAEDWMPCEDVPPFALRHTTCGKLTRPGSVCSECGEPITTRNVAMERNEVAPPVSGLA